MQQKEFALHYSKDGDYIEAHSHHPQLATICAVSCDRIITQQCAEFMGFDDENQSAIYVWDHDRTQIDNLIEQYSDHCEIIASHSEALAP